MMKNFLLLLALLTTTISHNVYAHGGAHAPVNESRALEIATITINQFVHFDAGLGFGKLDKSWNKIAREAKKIHQKGNGYYIVSTTNEQEEKTLYILMSLAGEVYDANLHGKFPGLK